MANTVRILAFAGSLRKGSLNKQALPHAVAAAREAGAEVTQVDLKDFPMPVYDGDIEESQGLPDNVKRFKQLMKSHAGFLICTPEYNSSIPGALKNVIDWASRSEEGEKPLECFRDKTAGLMSASPGSLGGIRSLAATRSILENIGTFVIPLQVAFPRADAGGLADPKLINAAKKMAAKLVEVTRKLNA